MCKVSIKLPLWERLKILFGYPIIITLENEPKIVEDALQIDNHLYISVKGSENKKKTTTKFLGTKNKYYE